MNRSSHPIFTRTIALGHEIRDIHAQCAVSKDSQEFERHNDGVTVSPSRIGSSVFPPQCCKRACHGMVSQIRQYSHTCDLPVPVLTVLETGKEWKMNEPSRMLRTSSWSAIHAETTRIRAHKCVKASNTNHTKIDVSLRDVRAGNSARAVNKATRSRPSTASRETRDVKVKNDGVASRAGSSMFVDDRDQSAPRRDAVGCDVADRVCVKVESHPSRGAQPRQA